jgi:hypothetical protein
LTAQWVDGSNNALTLIVFANKRPEPPFPPIDPQTGNAQPVLVCEVVGSRGAPNNTGTPALTSPTLPANPPMAALDATLRLGGVDVADIVSFDLTVDNGAVAPAVVGAKTSPTVMPGLNRVSMNLTILQKDMSYISGHLNETGYSLSFRAVPNMAEPRISSPSTFRTSRLAAPISRRCRPRAARGPSRSRCPLRWSAMTPPALVSTIRL